MEITQIYALAAGGSFLALLIIKGYIFFAQIVQLVLVFLSKYFTYSFVLRRHRVLGPWSRADILLQFLYIILNIFCITFRITSLKEAQDRAGTLFIINMMPLFFGLHLSFLADLLGLSLSNYRRVHRSVGIMSFALVMFYTFIAAQANFSHFFKITDNIYLLSVSRTTGKKTFIYMNIGDIYSRSINHTFASLYTKNIV